MLITNKQKIKCKQCGHKYLPTSRAWFFYSECVRANMPGSIGTDCPKCKHQNFLEHLTKIGEEGNEPTTTY